MSGDVTILDRYLDLHARNRTADVVALFAGDAWVEDPVGSPVLRGREAIARFYAGLHQRNGALEIERVGPTLAGGNELATHVRAALLLPDSPPAMDVLYVVAVDTGGRIHSLRAFY